MTLEERPFSMVMVDDDKEDIYSVSRAIRALSVPVAFQSMPDSESLFRYLEANIESGEGGALVDIDLVILDINLPRLSGFETLEILQKSFNNVFLPVIVFTTSDNFADARRCYELGANAVATKPTRYKDTVLLMEAAVQFWSLNVLNKPVK